VPFALAEAELTKQVDSLMHFEFSTTARPKLTIEQEGKENIEIDELDQNYRSFYCRNDLLVDFGPHLEQPVPRSLFENL
jgi:hypothetical protein